MSEQENIDTEWPYKAQKIDTVEIRWRCSFDDCQCWNTTQHNCIPSGAECTECGTYHTFGVVVL